MLDSVKFLTQNHLQKSKPGLQRIKPLMKALGSPQNHLKFIHVAGTNGKGSICAYLSNILIASGYKTGLFTSPYIWKLEERIQIDNFPISRKDLDSITQKVKTVADSLFDKSNYPTEFELYTAIAFMYFTQENCDVVVAEVGMGGLLDSTNIISKNNKLACVFASISIDHIEYLGDDVCSIAKEKAGIMCQGVPCFSVPQNHDVTAILKGQSNKTGCDIYFIDSTNINESNINRTERIYRTFKYRNNDYNTSLIADYQTVNCAVAIETINYLNDTFSSISQLNINAGIKNTFWPARFQIVNDNPICVIDGGHNLEGAQHFVSTFKEVFPDKTALLIIGVLADKQYKEMVNIFSSITNNAICIAPPNPRALDNKILAKEFSKNGVEATVENSFTKAAKIALNKQSKGQIICCVGSLYSAGKFYDLLKK